MLTGRLPFEGSSALNLIALKLDREAPSLADMTGDTWPASLERMLALMMARERDRRFASATDALAAWHEVCAAMGDLPRPSRPKGPMVVEEPGDDAQRTVNATISATYAEADLAEPRRR
jgi:serine/threonine-protein kinase